jgi:hypothetical protein
MHSFIRQSPIVFRRMTLSLLAQILCKLLAKQHNYLHSKLQVITSENSHTHLYKRNVILFTAWQTKLIQEK